MAKPVRRPQDELSYDLGGIALCAGGALGVFSLLFPNSGAASRVLAQGLDRLAGEGAGAVPLTLCALGVFALVTRSNPLRYRRTWGVGMLLLVFLALLHLPYPPAEAFTRAAAGLGGGLTGASVGWVLVRAFGPVGRGVVLGALVLAGLVLVTEAPLLRLGGGLIRLLIRGGRALAAGLRDFFFEVVEEEAVAVGRELAPLELPRSDTPSRPPPAPPTGRESPEPPAYQLPPLSLLARGTPRSTGRQRPDTEEKRRLIEETMASFGVRARVLEAQQGPVVTRFEVQPAPGVKVSRVIGLADDLALALAAQDVRIAPIAGKGVIGVEVPNSEVSPVHLRDVLESPEFKSAPPGLTVALGKDIAGRPLIANLDRLLHLLVAGTTGSGKSVCLNAIISSILLNYRPDQVKFVLIDPKVVELSVYDGIPHLLAPVITDPKQSAGALRWLVREMENRYELFAAAGVRDIGRYNALWPSGQAEGSALPYVLIVIDELADLMKIAPAEVEDAIWRLAQMARAAGIHLVVATQRPSVDVITGVIKANIPSRIAFAVSSQVDSRTILDAPGAERLIGQGDMLYHPVGAAKVVRGQGAFIADAEVEEIAAFVKGQACPQYRNGFLTEAVLEAGAGSEEEDELFPDAVRVVMETRQASISMVQRKLRVGYTRAARLIDAMEEKGIVGPPDGARPRELLMNWEQFRRDFPERRPRA
ncbi:MAG: DNA translocase FtsK [bacterium]|nr:DNA translocase FtsK [bacterium]